MVSARRFNTESIFRWFCVDFARTPPVAVLHTPANKACEATRWTFLVGFWLH